MKLHHVDHGGHGPALLVLHAFPLHSGMYDRLVPLLSDSFRVVTVDLPGLGHSEVPDVEPSMQIIASAVLGVLDAIGIPHAIVLGISTGGYVALQMVAQARERIDALVLGSTTPRRIEPDAPDARDAAAAQVERSASTDPVADSADEGLGETAHREQPELVDLVRGMIAEADPAGVAWVARAIAGRSDTTDVLRSFTGPVVLLFGSEDEATPPSRGEEMLALRGHAPTSLYVLAATGHLTALESPEEVAGILAELLPQVAD